jgi:meso-butanediol dehydrogenase / (S,S)-butanediol dehydrogenase / diacetyl reductase
VNPRFEGRTVVVTGAASGIGWETASQFLAEGATVVTGDQTLDVPDGAIGVRVDVSSAADVEGLVAAALAKTGQLDVMCNIAGIGSTTDVLDCTPEEWDRVFAVNAKGVFLGTKFALAPMLERRRGVIVNMASVAALVGLRDRAAYCASKGAVVAFTKQVAMQYASQGVRCVSICPGTTDTAWVGRLLAEAPDPESRRDDLVARQPLGRLADPAEIAKAVLYVASDDAAFMTGSELVIDGGLTAA